MDPIVECISYSSIAYLQIGGHSINDCPLDDNVTLEVGAFFIFILIISSLFNCHMKIKCF
jgi:hypothetical protein